MKGLASTEAVEVRSGGRDLERWTRWRFCVAVLALAVSTAGAVQRPDDAVEPAQVFTDSVSVMEVVIPVQVLHRGLPVTDLERDSFEVWDRTSRGRVQRQIVAFEKLDLRDRSPRDAAGDPLVAAVGQAASDLDSDQLGDGRFLLLLFDLGGAGSHRLARAVVSAREMVAEQLHPADRVGVATIGGGEASLVLVFTADRRRVEAALDLVAALLDRDRVAQRRALAVLRSGEQSLQQLSRQLGAEATLALVMSRGARQPSPAAGGVDLSLLAPPGAGIDPGFGDLVAMSQGLAAGAVLSLERRRTRALGDLVILLRDVPDPKYLLLFSPGLGGFSLMLQPGSSDPRVGPALVGHGITRAYSTLVGDLRRSGWVVQSFDVSGVGLGGDESLFYLAHETGGELYDNYGRLEVATAELIDTTSVTYRLSIRVEDIARDGRYHPLDVRLTRGPEGARLISREGYYAPRARRSLRGLERHLAAAGELLTAAPRSDLLASVSIVTVPGNGSRVRVCAVLFVDIAALESEVGLDGRLRLEVLGVATERRTGRTTVLDLFRQSVAIDADGEEGALAGGGLKFVADLQVEPGEVELRFEIRETLGDRRFLYAESLEVPAVEEHHLTSPMVVDQGPRSLTLEEDGSRLLSVDNSPFVIAGNPMVPAPPVFELGRVSAVFLHAYGRWSKASRLQALLEPLAGEGPRTVDLEVKDAVTEGARTSLLAWLRPTALAPGRYRLVVRWLEEERVLAASSAAVELR